MSDIAVIEVYRDGDEVCVQVVKIPDHVDEQTETLGVAFHRRHALALAWLIVKKALAR